MIYIIKENRTYDQVLGDEPYGNGDPALALFGREVTPNLHALAERFVLLDNFYDCGEASGDGWPWSTQGQASEYVIKNLPYNYSGRGRNYDFEGANNNYPVGGFPTTDPYGQPLVPNSPFHDPTKAGVAPAIPDVSEAPGGHIWDDVLHNLNLNGTGLTTKYRNYGFFSSFGDNYYIPGQLSDRRRAFSPPGMTWAASPTLTSAALTPPMPTVKARTHIGCRLSRRHLRPLQCAEPLHRMEPRVPEVAGHGPERQRRSRLPDHPLDARSHSGPERRQAHAPRGSRRQRLRRRPACRSRQQKQNLGQHGDLRH